MIIQCRENTFNLICKIMQPLIPHITQTRGGYIHTFDKDWICVIIDESKISINQTADLARIIQFVDIEIVVGITQSTYPKIIQQGVPTSEQYIFLRYNTDNNTQQLLHAFMTYIIFVTEQEEQNDNRS